MVSTDLTPTKYGNYTITKSLITGSCGTTCKFVVDKTTSVTTVTTVTTTTAVGAVTPSEQLYTMKINIIDSALSVLLIWMLLPRLGM